MKHRNHLWPIIAGSAVGAVGVAVAATKLRNKKGETPADIAGEKIQEMTREAKQRIEDIVKEVRESLPEHEKATTQELNKLIAEAKSRLDQAAEQMKTGMRKLYGQSVGEDL